MNHRAVKQINIINSTSHDVLKFLGGSVSPEMEMQKILWLKQNLTEQKWSEIGHFIDLADFLKYKSTGSLTLSLCCLVCKWNYVGFGDYDLHTGGCDSFFSSIGLPERINDNYSKIENTIFSSGECIGGLSVESSSDLGIELGTPVITFLIDVCRWYRNDQA